MHTSMVMTLNPPTKTGLRDDGSASGFRQFHDREIQRLPRDEEYRALSFDSHHSEMPRDKAKKDKKWSLGKLFRRKKKDDSGTSSESDEITSTKSETRRKSKKRKRQTGMSVSNFDHIVVNRNGRRAQSVIAQKEKEIVEKGVLSDPSAGFVGYKGRAILHGYVASEESMQPQDDSGMKSGNTSLDGSVKRGRKGRMKARVEALRNSMRKDSSSDEDSQKSSTSSSILRFRSDDSLVNNSHSRDGSLSRKSRSARTERYIKRLSRDEENQLNKEAELLQQGYTKAEVELLTRTPTSQSSGYGTSKRENHYVHTKQEHVNSNDPNKTTVKSESMSSFPSTYSFPSSINFNARVNNESIHYSIPYVQSNAHKEPMYINQIQDQRMGDGRPDRKDNLMCVKFPLGNVTNLAREEKGPPVPPPRDLQRKAITPVSMLLETEKLRNRNATEDIYLIHGVPNNDFQRIMRRSQERSPNLIVNGLRRPMSNSEDHIATRNKDNNKYSNLRRLEQPRPASVSIELNQCGMYANTNWRNKFDNPKLIKPEPVRQDFLYYADQCPRSRRPISIQSSQTHLEQPYYSDSQPPLNHYYNNIDWSQRKPRNASEFWRKIDNEECKRKSQQNYPLSMSRTVSENSTSLVINSRFGVQTNGSRPNCESLMQRFSQRNDRNFNHNVNQLTLHNTPRDMVDGSQKWKSAIEYNRSLTAELPREVNPLQRTHGRTKSETINTSYKSPSDDEKSSERRKSTNLDDALNELEAIYNSLGLGDEDLLDRAERRELMSPKFKDQVNDCNGNDSMELTSQPTVPLKISPIFRRSTLPDKLQDDMAFRRLKSKEKPVTKDSPTPQISYMLASPVYVPYADEKISEDDPREPDVVQDDVMYRNMRHANNHLRQLDPQPPFGIPIGPVTPAPQSDYLHANPENRTRSRLPRRSPDLVSDDLAYRTLRKDNRHSTLFGEDYESNTNNNCSYNELTLNIDHAASLRKKRAVRSLSANIFSMIQKEIDDALNVSKLATLQKTQSISDVNKSLKQMNGDNSNLETSPRNKVKQRHNTVNIVFNNVALCSLPYTKDDSVANKDEKKPSTSEKSQSSSPANRSPQPGKKPGKEEFQRVLTMLAQEAMETSNKLGIALAEFDKNRNTNFNKNFQNDPLSNSQARTIFLNSLSHKKSNEESNIKLDEMHSKNMKKVSNESKTKLDEMHSKNIKQPWTKSSHSSKGTSHSSKGQKTEDSLIAISNQLHKVEDKLKHSFERIVNVPDESLKLSAYIMETNKKLNAQECKIIPENKTSPVIITPKIQEDVVMVHNACAADTCGNTPCGSTEANINELNELKSFNELKEGISGLLDGISQVNEKIFNKETHAPEKTQESLINSINCPAHEDDLINNDNAESTEYNSSEELANIFNNEDNKSPGEMKKEPEQPPKIEEDKHSDLNSPRLVQSMNQQLRRFSDDCTDSQISNDKPSQSNAVATVPWRTKKSNESQSERKGVN